ncbi:MAG: LON peptidase substrate-binding domain-containing protein [Alphaproteobacteria bacterium]|nr:LON peptidase substrate-binding domain-containing protein [Alphaproteobacteria bacterium]
MPSVPIPSLADMPAVVPVFPLTDALLLPRGRLPLNIFEPRYLAMVDDAMRTTRVIGMIQPATTNDQLRKPPLYPVGCLGRITSWSETGDGRVLITLSGQLRFRIKAELKTTTPYRQVETDYTEFATDLEEPIDDQSIDRARLGHCLKNYLKQKNLDADWQSIERAPAEVLVNSLAMICPFNPAEKQALLEAPELSDRAQLLTTLIEMTTTSGPQGGTLQ